MLAEQSQSQHGSHNDVSEVWPISSTLDSLDHSPQMLLDAEKRHALLISRLLG